MGALQVLWEQFGVKDIFDILIVSFIFYQALFIIHGTRAVQILTGLGLLFALFWIGLSFQLHSLNWLLSHFFDVFIIVFIILFQEQIRTALSFVGGGRKAFSFFADKQDYDFDIEEIVEAVSTLSRQKIGALLVIERKNGLQNYMNTGTSLNCELHSDVLYALFESSGPLHDGAIIISHSKIASAGSFLPLSKNIEIDRHLGTRHRAGLGISEITDAVAIIVSEETGKMSLALDGKFYECENESTVRQYLKHLIVHDFLDLKKEESLEFSGEKI